MPLFLLRWLNRLGFRRDLLIFMHPDDCYLWGDHLGPKTPGNCSRCGGPVVFEKQNAPFVKVCNRCAFPSLYRIDRRNDHPN